MDKWQRKFLKRGAATISNRPVLRFGYWLQEHQVWASANGYAIHMVKGDSQADRIMGLRPAFWNPDVEIPGFEKIIRDAHELDGTTIKLKTPLLRKALKTFIAKKKQHWNAVHLVTRRADFDDTVMQAWLFADSGQMYYLQEVDIDAFIHVPVNAWLLRRATIKYANDTIRYHETTLKVATKDDPIVVNQGQIASAVVMPMGGSRVSDLTLRSLFDLPDPNEEMALEEALWD